MNKIIVEVHIPAIGKIYDVRIPRDIQIFEAAYMITSLIANVDVGLYAKENEGILCDYDTGTILDINALVDDSGLVNGSRVLLV